MATVTAYEDALEFLFPRVTTIKFGLDTTRTLLGAVGMNRNMRAPGRFSNVCSRSCVGPTGKAVSRA